MNGRAFSSIAERLLDFCKTLCEAAGASANFCRSFYYHSKEEK